MKEGGENDMTNLDGLATNNNILDNDLENMSANLRNIENPDTELNPLHFVTVNEVKKYNRQLRKIDKGDG
jgi:hypothetical protein